MIRYFATIFLVAIAVFSMGNIARAGDGCTLAQQDVINMNGPALLQASSDCAKAGKIFDALFLLHIGSIRLETDLAILFPASIADANARLAFQDLDMGYGDDLQYRNADFSATLFDQIENWTPEFDAAYMPGWGYKQLISKNTYSELVREVKNYRLAILDNESTLIRRDDFYKIYMQLQALHTKHGGGIDSNNEDYQRVSELWDQAHEIRKRISKPLPEVMYPKPQNVREDKEAIHNPLFSGLNGPDYQYRAHFSSYAEVEKSWLRYSLSNLQMAEIRKQVDFEDQQVVVAAFGERKNVVALPQIYWSGYNSAENIRYVVHGLGIQGRECNLVPATSYPFIVYAIKKVSENADTHSTYKKFEDGCKPVLSGEPGAGL